MEGSRKCTALLLGGFFLHTRHREFVSRLFFAVGSCRVSADRAEMFVCMCAVLARTPEGWRLDL